jgi:2-polyprenyl-6-hydroxyphenyl methylase/3-demethylubiquinone-9 3-methyltransferase
MSDRYGFGANWASFIETAYSAERRDIAKKNLLGFLGRSDLKGVNFLDIGSGSGIHSLAAHDAGVSALRSFDYDEMSVKTTSRLRDMAGAPSHWVVERGDALDPAYMESLGKWDIVYSWGVLHHTGAMWDAITNAAGRVKSGGLFFIALYSSNVAYPSTDFWLDVKKRYNSATPAGKRRMEYWYLWRFGLDRNPLRLPKLLKQMYDKKKQRGMNYMVDVRDWLGGWPMEYADDQEVVDFLEERFGHQLLKISTGEACTEFLFKNIETPKKKTIVSEMVSKRKSLTE